jgi:hypothetical protein
MNLDEIYLLPNMVRTQAEGWKLYQRLNDVCVKFLGLNLHYLTAIENDELVLAALRKYHSVLDFAPGSAATRDFRRLAQICQDLNAHRSRLRRIAVFYGEAGQPQSSNTMRALSPVKQYQQQSAPGEELVMAHLGLVKRVAIHFERGFRPSWSWMSSFKWA